MSELAPVVLFVYNRPSLTRQTLESLSQNELAADSSLFIYSDGPKTNHTPEDLKNIKEVRKIIHERNWCKSVTVIESEQNNGLANSIIKGVTEIVNKYEKIIVIEDDILLSKYFLKFMNGALELYKDDSKVLSIGSWTYFCRPEKVADNFFLRYPDSIAWATFKRAWKLFETDAASILKKLQAKKLIHYFNADDATPYFEKMLKLQIANRIDSWAIRWTATACLHKMYSFFPQMTLSKHVGFGMDATHEKGDKDYNRHLILSPLLINIKEIPIEENKAAFNEWKRFIMKLEGKTLMKKFKEKIIEAIPPTLLKIYHDIRK